ncbi:hypothetical protein D477_004506 [Arthrobacter crystallopoietes BAB-32]|uniref:Uncharacterized protein n=1 Tax=Arthrobacter crystallopoietes BAB-32 TaxID=1246476 RepID=N1VAS7_9MICC|nr:hypothetical protein [Arthrobacter crystallopoietes]EMY35408.1 hypothetical protein D477_004506 [Arthrobacter crystallopoietes BAB-32]
MTKSAGSSGERSCDSSINVEVTKRTTGGCLLGFAVLTSLLWLIIASVSGGNSGAALAVFLLVLLSSVPIRLALRRKSIDRIQAAVNDALARELHTHVRVSRKQADRLHDCLVTKIEDGNQSYKFVAKDPQPGTADSNAISTDFVVTITAKHGDLGLAAYQDMARAVLESLR